MGNPKPTSSYARMPANVTALPIGADVKSRARRQSPLPANGTRLARVDQVALTDIAQRFAPGAQAVVAGVRRRESDQPPPQMRPIPAAPAASPSAVTAPRGLRALIALLIVVALVPSAGFAAMIWLGALHVGWPRTELAKEGPSRPLAVPASVAGGLAIESPKAEADPKPAAAPEAAALPAPAAEGQGLAVAPEPVPVKTLALGAPPEESLAAGPSPEPDPAVSLEPEITGSIAPAGGAVLAALPYDPNLIGVVSWDDQKHRLLGATGVEEVFTAPSEPATPPAQILQPAETDEADKTWITAPQFVNLRKGPTSSAAVISIVAKGAKLEVLGRKRGWVKVADPESAETGWIYTGSKVRRARKAKEETADGGSFWSRLFGSSD
jgi:hypothetical protein